MASITRQGGFPSLTSKVRRADAQSAPDAFAERDTLDEQVRAAQGPRELRAECLARGLPGLATHQRDRARGGMAPFTGQTVGADREHGVLAHRRTRLLLGCDAEELAALSHGARLA